MSRAPRRETVIVAEATSQRQRPRVYRPAILPQGRGSHRGRCCSPGASRGMSQTFYLKTPTRWARPSWRWGVLEPITGGQIHHSARQSPPAPVPPRNGSVSTAPPASCPASWCGALAPSRRWGALPPGRRCGSAPGSQVRTRRPEPEQTEPRAGRTGLRGPWPPL